jgi:hypothetical protein
VLLKREMGFLIAYVIMERITREEDIDWASLRIQQQNYSLGEFDIESLQGIRYLT